MKYAKTLKNATLKEIGNAKNKCTSRKGGGWWKNLHMYKHSLPKLLKLLATCTKLSHTHTLLKDMEETTFQSASKQNPSITVFHFCKELSQNMKL